MLIVNNGFNFETSLTNRNKIPEKQRKCSYLPSAVQLNERIFYLKFPNFVLFFIGVTKCLNWGDLIDENAIDSLKTV